MVPIELTVGAYGYYERRRCNHYIAKVQDTDAEFGRRMGEDV